MGKEATATFIGHKECYGVQAEDVRREVEKLIASGVTDFLNGGMGGFDWMCARVVSDLKKSYSQIRNYLVIPYLTFNIAELKYFDDIIYPEGFEKYHFKAAIPARNRYLVDNAAYALCYKSVALAFSVFPKQRQKEGNICSVGCLPVPAIKTAHRAFVWLKWR